MTSTLERPEAADIDPRFAARRHEVARSQQRRRRRVAFALLAVVALVASVWGITRTALLDVDRIDVTGAEHTSVDDVLAASGLHTGQPMLDVDAGAVRSRLEALPWVADASVRVHWPDHVSIAVQERTPVAAVSDPQRGWLLIDDEGRVLGPATEPGWLVVEGLTVTDVGQPVQGPVDDALSVVRLLTPGLRTRVAAVAVGGDGQVTLRLQPQGQALLGPATDLEAKVASLRTLFAQVDDRGLATVDVRVPDRPALTRTGA